jgi:CRISPR-associated protein Cmr2
LTSYLYVLSIGPVQDFIAAARRTRDLWFGSRLLSDISKAAAREISNSGGKLIFPALDREELEISKRPDGFEKRDDFNVANIILAELPEIDNPSDLDERARKASLDVWTGYAEGARVMAGDIVRGDIWDEQVGDVVDFYSAWVPINGNYSDARNKLMRLLAGRKSIRDFIPGKGRAGVPKSSLDGSRESVIKKDKKIPSELALKMRLTNGEQLCAVGLTKRLGGPRESFPSVVRVAADPWIRGILSSDITEAINILNEIANICKGNSNIASGTGRKLYQKFPFDGQVLYPMRLARLMKPLSKNRKPGTSWVECLSKSDRDDLTSIKSLVDKLQKDPRFGFGEPDPYLAILVADGDRIGKMISARKEQDEHRAFSKKLADFAGKAREIVEENNGCLVYSGGDDVLAFLPVDCCLKAAQELHECFGKLLKGFKDEENNEATISVGIAIGHSTEPLEDLLEYGRAAKRSAKKGSTIEDDRNGLAVHLYTRSGGEPIRIREQWKSTGEIGLDGRLIKWTSMHSNNELPGKAAYDLCELARDYENWEGVSEKQLLKLITKDAWRLLKRKKSSQDGKNLNEGTIATLLEGVNSSEKISRLADELILARRLASSSKRVQPSSMKTVQGIGKEAA